MYSYLVFETTQDIKSGLALIRRNRLYTPGSGKIFSMCDEPQCYVFEKIALVMMLDGTFWKPFGVAVISKDKTATSVMEVNVWVRPKFRRKGFATALLDKINAISYSGIRCYDMSKAAKMLYTKNLSSPVLI